MNWLLRIFVFMPLICLAQDARIKFRDDLSWKEVLTKARAEYKFIFIELTKNDCKECEAMDNGVYNLGYVGEFVNNEFISLRGVSNSSGELFSLSKQKFPFDQELLKSFKINRFPNYLFFSPDGKFVHQGSGQLLPNSFIHLAREAIDPSKQYYAVLDKYFLGLKDYPLLGYIALKAKELGDDDTAILIAADYKKNYLDRLPHSEIFSPSAIDFLSKFPDLENTKGRFFNSFLRNRDLVDKENYKGCADKFIRFYINRDEVENRLYKNSKHITTQPDWEQLAINIKNKYGKEYSGKIISKAKINFYRKLFDWQNYVKSVNDEYEKTPPKPGEGFSSDGWALNGRAWDIFVNCNDSVILESALRWSNISLQLDPTNVQYYDTKSNLLYKLGRVNEAILWEEKAIKQGIGNASLSGGTKGEFYDDYIITLDKMKKGIPTWRVPVDNTNKK